MEVARREKRKPLIRLSDVQKERAAYWLQPAFVLTEPKPTFLNLRVRRRIKGRQLESRPVTFVEQRYFNYMDTESLPNWPFRFFINDLWKISGQLPPSLFRANVVRIAVARIAVARPKDGARRMLL